MASSLVGNMQKKMFFFTSRNKSFLSSTTVLTEMSLTILVSQLV